MHNNFTLPVELKDVPLFEGLGEEERQQVLDAMVLRSFVAGRGRFYGRGSRDTERLGVNCRAECEIVREPDLGTLGKTVQLAEITPFETFGEMTMFSDRPHCTSVWAKTDVKTLKLRKSDFKKLKQRAPEVTCRLACNLVNILSDRLRRMDDWITELLDEHKAAQMHIQWNELRDRLQETFQGQLL